MARKEQTFQSIRSEGGLLPPDILRRILDPQEKILGTLPADYGLPKGERLNEVITQSWNRLRRHWSEFQDAAGNLASSDAGTGLTNEKWSLPLLRELGFGVLPATAGPEINGRTYAINRFAGPVPVHLVGCNVSLDRRAAGVRGAAAANPHGLVQEFLNRSPESLWGIVSNGLQLRLLRDNLALSRQSFLEFDLQTMFAGELYSDFVLLWLVAHATRFMPKEEGKPETCILEEWTKIAEEQGTRALGELKIGVEKALQILGEGFTSHPKNTDLRDALRTGKLSPAGLHSQLLRVIYRLIFLFVAEDRLLDNLPLLHPRDDSDDARLARERYAAYYSTSRLRELAGRIKGSRHGDLWRQFQILVNALSGDADFAETRQMLALPAFGSMLWNPAATAYLNEAQLTNYDFLETLRNLAFTRQGKILRPVDYKNLGAEELGGIYESLLALSPQISADGARFTFAEFAGSERKTSGSYYTPDSLVQCLLDSALDPVIEEAIKGKKGKDAEEAILSLKVCDPAVGSGHFLVGAAHRMARHLAAVRAQAQGESEPSPLAHQQALRDIIGHCLYGVDVNPMAAELCRVSLWLEALEPGKPLSFLDHHIRVGNSLLGITPELIAKGLPEEAFNPIEGDDKKICTVLKRRNRQEREGRQTDMMHAMVAESSEQYNTLESRSRSIDGAPDNTLEDIRQKAEQFNRLMVSPEYRNAQLLADAWCAAFVWKKQKGAPEAITTDTIRRLEGNPEALTTAQRQDVEKLAGQYRFFHWHIAFPEVFARGGFDCVLGNPPWERVKLQEKEWFAERSPAIANAPNAAARKRMIEELKQNDPLLHRQFLDDLRTAEGESHFLRHSDRYPLCGRGDINLYAVFAEGMRCLLNDRGLMGAVLPTGIATDDTTKFFFQDVVGKKSLVSLYDFENRQGLFPDVDSRMKFCLFTAGQGLRPSSGMAEFAFFLHAVEDLGDPERRFSLSPEDIELLNPNTRTCPIFRSRRDAELTKAIYRRVPVLVREARDGRPEENPWGIKFSTMFHMSNDSHLFRTREQLEADGWVLEGNVFRKDGEEYLPLYEAKMIHHFDHRWATYDGLDTRELTLEEKQDPSFFVLPRYWVRKEDVEEALKNTGWTRRWLLGYRNITNTTNERTAVAAVFQTVAVGNSMPLLLILGDHIKPSVCALINAVLGTLIYDYVVRQKLGGTNFTFGYFNQIAIHFPSNFDNQNTQTSSINYRLWISFRILELTYTAWDLAAFARDCGWDGPPFRWNEERRFLLRCELDAAFFHLYLPATPDGQWKPARVAEGAVRDETPEELAELKKHFPTPRDAVAYIMDTFPIVRRKDEEKYGEYRTKRVILEIYDEMAEAVRTGRPYQTRLNPPPADPRCCHPPREIKET
ncbi:MAG TPA: N-6 DNA methylase [Smithella sp.]|nr:N-6 DNA methylase [Smithella sp.]